MATENRGGARVPDGVARPQGIFGTGANQRTDMTELPGTPGTPLPPSLNEPDVQSQKRALSGLDKFKPADGSKPLFGPSEDTQVIQAGLDTGPGAGPEALIKGPTDTSNELAYQESLRYYSLINRLNQIENLNTQTKALLRKMKANAPLNPYQM